MRPVLAIPFMLLTTVVPSTAFAQTPDGQISGVVVDATGQPLADQRVELRQPSSAGPGRLVATTDATGQFTYRGLRPDRYEVELRVEGRVVARSGPIELSEGNMRANGVTLIQPRRPPRWARTERQVLKLPRVSTRQLLGASEVATSFEELRTILKPGHEVAFVGRDSRGYGRIAEISGDRLVVVRRRLFRTQELVLTEDTLQRVDIVDPVAKGALLGAAVGGSLGLALILDARRIELNRSLTGGLYYRRRCGNMCGLAYLLGIAAPGIGIAVGANIDGSINEPVYESPGQARRVTLAPLTGPRRIGVMARVHF